MSYRILADYKWVVQAAKKCSYDEIIYMPESIVNYLDGGVSSRKVWQNFGERFRLHYELFGLFQVLINLPNYCRRTLREVKRLVV